MKGKEFFTVSVLVCAILVLGASVSGAWNCAPRVLPMQQEYYGKTYSEWAIKWWQWAIGTPASTNPLTDATGEFCASGQKGPVWFLATTLAGQTTPTPATRTCTIPSGKSLFFPVINASYFAFPGENWTGNEPGLRAQADCSMPTVLEAEVDGVPARDLFAYFEHSPIFQVSLPAGDIFGVGPLLLSPSVGLGYYLFLEPLRKGTHTIHWKATWTCKFPQSSDDYMPYTEEVTYNLTVTDRWPPHKK